MVHLVKLCGRSSPPPPPPFPSAPLPLAVLSRVEDEDPNEIVPGAPVSFIRLDGALEVTKGPEKPPPGRVRRGGPKVCGFRSASVPDRPGSALPGTDRSDARKSTGCGVSPERSINKRGREEGGRMFYGILLRVTRLGCRGFLVLSRHIATVSRRFTSHVSACGGPRGIYTILLSEKRADLTC